MNPLKLSYSSTEELHTCARLFEINKLLQAEVKEDNIDFVTGKAVGEGIQLLFQGHSLETATWAAYKHWLVLGIEHENKKKSFWRVVKHLEKFYNITLPNEFLNKGWELVYFTDASGKKIPACELSFRLVLSKDYVYRGYIDVVIYNRLEDIFAVVEVKTSGITANVAMYQNSFQGSSYSLVLDKITGRSSHTVFFPVFEFPGFDQPIFTFHKNANTKLRWLTSLALDCQMIDLYKEHRSFPLNGKNCYNFFRPCKYLGLCELSNKSLGKVAPDGGYVEPILEEKDYHFTFSLEELLAESAVQGVT